MASYTLLDLVQTVLSSMDSDEVNSIGDTAESMQVARLVKTVYFNMVARADLPENTAIVQLAASGSSAQPVLMLKPDNVRRIEWLKYNIATTDNPEDRFQYVHFLPLEQFLDRTQQLNTDETDVETMTINDITYYFKNNIRPSFYTIVDDYYIIFDAYDAEVDTTLQASKTMCLAKLTPAFELSDTFVPELDDRQFPLLLNEVKSLAFYEIKQQVHEKAEQESKRQWVSLQRTKNLEKPNWFNQLPNFGRK